MSLFITTNFVKLVQQIFLQWGYRMDVDVKDLRKFENVVDDEGDQYFDKEIECAMCSRVKWPTFHHLIPRDVHGKYVDWVLTDDIVASVLKINERKLQPAINLPENTNSGYSAGGRGGQYRATKVFLSHYGVLICRQCHSQVHRTETNADLAKEYNTLEKLVAHPKLCKWVEWAMKQKK